MPSRKGSRDMFIVIELQKDANGNVANVVTAHETQAAAESKYHTVLAAAAISEVPMHAAALLSEEGFSIANQCYKH